MSGTDVPLGTCQKCSRGRGTPRGCSACQWTGETNWTKAAIFMDASMLDAYPGTGDNPPDDMITSGKTPEIAGEI